MKFWFDTEFIDDGHTIEPISIGIVSEDNKTYYAEFFFDHNKAGEWIEKNVFPHLDFKCKDRYLIRDEIKDFLGDAPEIWGYYADYDWVVLCQLFGRMIDLPKGWPSFCLDVKQMAFLLGNPQLPKQEQYVHHALSDAIWTMQAHKFLNTLVRRTR